MNICSIDIRAAYDNVDHNYLFRLLNRWRRISYISHETLDYLRFLFREYKIGVVEKKNSKFNRICLINKGLP